MRRGNLQDSLPSLRRFIIQQLRNITEVGTISYILNNIAYFVISTEATLRAWETLFPRDSIMIRISGIVLALRFLNMLGNIIPMRVDLLQGELALNFNDFFNDIEQKSLVVYNQNSENDQRYLAAGLDSDSIPEEFKCPISTQIFTVPVKPKDSKVAAIELSALQYWFDQEQSMYPYQQPTHPMTRQALDMKNLVVDTKLAARAKNFVEAGVAKKVTRIGNLLICNSRLYAKVEREHLIKVQSITLHCALIILEHFPPTSFHNFVIGLALFNTFISHVPMPRKQIEESFTVFAQCINLFRDSHGIAAENSNSQNFSITYQPNFH